MEKVINILSDPLIAGILALIGVIFALGGAIVWITNMRRKKKGDFITVWKRSWFLRPKHIMGLRASKRMGFEKYYLERDHDDQIQKCIMEGKNILIVGTPLSGKTRSVYEAYKRAGWRCFITVPNIDELEGREYRFPRLIDVFFGVDRRRYLFLDDIDKYAANDKIASLVRRFNEKRCSFIATCRSGDELEKFKTTELGYVFREPIEILRITDEQEEWLREEVPKKTSKEIPTHFDHTIGSIFLALEAMQQRYEHLEDEYKKVLLSIKRLYLLGVYRGLNVFPIGWIKAICRGKYHLDLESDDYTCDSICNDLHRNNFIQLQKPNVRVEEAYIENVIEKTEIAVDDFLEALTYFKDDPEALYHLGNRAINIGEVTVEKEALMTIAVDAFTKALETWTGGEDHARVQNSIGIAYGRLSEVRETRENLLRAITAYEEALKIRTPDRFPIQYALTMENLGIAYGAFAQLENREEHCWKARECYHKALQILTEEDFPLNYRKLLRNMEVLDGDCSDKREEIDEA